MVKRCIAAGCSNTYSDGVSLFNFPKDQGRRQQWIRQVQRTRAEWKGPSEHSVLCSDHFTEDCFEPDTAIAASLGLSKPRRRLKVDAVPTIFHRPVPRASATGGKRVAGEGPSCSEPRKIRRGAYEKRERARVRLITTSTLCMH